jgi:hypothetical protein
VEYGLFFSKSTTDTVGGVRLPQSTFDCLMDGDVPIQRALSRPSQKLNSIKIEQGSRWKCLQSLGKNIGAEKKNHCETSDPKCVEKGIQFVNSPTARSCPEGPAL